MSRRINQFGFGGNRDLDPDPGIFEGIPPIEAFAEAPCRGFANNPRISRL